MMNIFVFVSMSRHWDVTGSWNSCFWKTRPPGLPYMINTIAVGVPVTQGARASAATQSHIDCDTAPWYLWRWPYFPGIVTRGVLTYKGWEKWPKIADGIFKCIFLEQIIKIRISYLRRRCLWNGLRFINLSMCWLLMNYQVFIVIKKNMVE